MKEEEYKRMNEEAKSRNNIYLRLLREVKEQQLLRRR